MPTARTARTAVKVSKDIDDVSAEKNIAMADYRKKQKALSEEYDTAVAKEQAQAKIDRMTDTEKNEFAKLLEESR